MPESEYKNQGFAPEADTIVVLLCQTLSPFKTAGSQSHVLLGLNPVLINATGYSWTGDYVTVTGDLCADSLSNIASEQRAKVVYEYLYRQVNTKSTGKHRLSPEPGRSIHPDVPRGIQ